MRVSSKDPQRGIYFGTQQLEEVEKFTYLGSVISHDGDAEDVKCRIGKAAAEDEQDLVLPEHLPQDQTPLA